MRLLNTNTLTFTEFFDEQTPPYAILSHRWGPQEVTYQDFLSGKNTDGPGYTKILGACQLAERRNREWIWIDTCCIDKTSSAELSEAINSMFEWYKSCAECYAFLNDVQAGSSQQQTAESLSKSVWFSRGWTLQELLAPSSLLLYDNEWKFTGTKGQLASVLSSITGIPELYLLRPEQLLNASVAVRMSWASRRTTTRIEDMAYSLLGLFNVNMSLLYGEREKAFFRLQLEIVKVSDDESIFAWTSPQGIGTNGKSAPAPPCGMFAPWPTCFSGFGNVRNLPLSPEDRVPWQWTNKGLEIHISERDDLNGGMKLMEMRKYGQDRRAMTLGCWVDDENQGGGIGVGDAKTLGKISKGKIVTIELQRFGTRWKRVNAGQVLLAKEFERYDSGYFRYPVVQRVYYVAQ